ncbi:chaperone protein clpd chloroplastic [Phtheirospermum japonicum]|uniref:Chaperone protein clpd chloroplastic n=1 Tax=Phtheirospermum japonicum TaxID=374723 RepID=A0A830BEX7_9LAMI|nr:chaperone protein clpd chloroplastic [Phtheirospermum japonicum]
MELSCSPPLSVNSLLNPGPHRRVSSSETHPRCQKVVAFSPNCPPSSSYTAAPTNACSTSSASSYFGISIAQQWNTSIPVKKPKRSFFVVSGIFERFTERAIKAVMFSQKEAKTLGRDMVYTQHLLLGLIAEDRATGGFLGSGITIDVAREAVQSLSQGDNRNDGNGGSPQQSEASATDVPFSTGAKRVFEAAVEYSRTMGYNFIAPEHIAIGLFTVDDGSVNRVLKRLGVNVNRLAAMAVSRLLGELAKEGREPSSPAFKKSREKLFPEKTTRSKSPELAREKRALDLFCVDLTARASSGSIDPVIGRDTEIQRIIQILCRRTKSNPILLGEAGVGKTAIAEGLAISIADGNIPSFLMKKRILSLDVGLLIAGAKERGELEGRVTMLIKEIKKSGNIILFIDEVHTLIGSGVVGKGNKGSGLDIANLLKPSLGRGEMQCIASTTMDEFRLHFEKDKALARRFQPVFINEPSEEDAVQILLGLREKYEDHHKCAYTLEAINAAVHLSARYIPDRYLPDKAIDLIDEAGSRARMEASKSKKEKQVSVLSKPPSDIWKEIRTVQAMHEASLATKLTGSDDTSRMEEDGKLNPNPSFVPSFSDDEILVVGPEDIAAVASLWSGVPVNKLTADERMLLVGLDEQLKKRVIGQDEAVAAICRAVKRSRVGLKDPDRPIAAMLFCGPTGVGKTELTKALAASYFGSESTMLRLDMSEYMERHTVSKLIGSPPGYVGYGEGGTLTEAIRKRPFTVVLLDEIEKAHPDIFNILLQLFEDGHLTDSQGRTVSFKNALVVMTSNVGSAAIAKGRQKGFGFFTDQDDSTSYAGMKALLMEELKGYFRPELLNRIDEVVVFRPLEKPQMLEILDIMLHEVKGRLTSLGIGLEVSEATMDLICQQGYDRSYGARPLRRAVTQIIEDLVSESLLSGDYKPGDIAVIHLDDSGNPVICFFGGGGYGSRRANLVVGLGGRGEGQS